MQYLLWPEVSSRALKGNGTGQGGGRSTNLSTPLSSPQHEAMISHLLSASSLSCRSTPFPYCNPSYLVRCKAVSSMCKSKFITVPATAPSALAPT